MFDQTDEVPHRQTVRLLIAEDDRARGQHGGAVLGQGLYAMRSIALSARELKRSRASLAYNLATSMRCDRDGALFNDSSTLGQFYLCIGRFQQ